MCSINYLSVEHIYLIHAAAIRTFGGEPGEFPHTKGRLESVVAQQFPVFGVDKYPSAPQKAAMLLYFLTKGHCFVDGNKRVGIQSAIVFLTLNGYKDGLPDGEGYDKTIEVAASQVPESERDAYIDALAGWLSKWFTEIP